MPSAMAWSRRVLWGTNPVSYLKAPHHSTITLCVRIWTFGFGGSTKSNFILLGPVIIFPSLGHSHNDSSGSWCWLFPLPGMLYTQVLPIRTLISIESSKSPSVRILGGTIPNVSPHWHHFALTHNMWWLLCCLSCVLTLSNIFFLHGAFYFILTFLLLFVFSSNIYTMEAEVTFSYP